MNLQLMNSGAVPLSILAKEITDLFTFEVIATDDDNQRYISSTQLYKTLTNPKNRKELMEHRAYLLSELSHLKSLQRNM